MIKSNIFLDKVTIDNKETLYRLLQYSLFEESETDLNEMNATAEYEYKYFDNYFTDKDREAYFIREKNTNKLLGFAMINTYTQIFDKGYSIAEYMVIEIFNKHKGNWEVKPSFNNNKAYLFWKNVIEDYTNNNCQFKDGIFIFTNI